MIGGMMTTNLWWSHSGLVTDFTCFKDRGFSGHTRVMHVHMAVYWALDNDVAWGQVWMIKDTLMMMCWWIGQTLALCLTYRCILLMGHPPSSHIGGRFLHLSPCDMFGDWLMDLEHALHGDTYHISSCVIFAHWLRAPCTLLLEWRWYMAHFGGTPCRRGYF